MSEEKIVLALKGVIIYGGRVLIIKRNEDDIGGGTWETVGGKLDFGESLEEALIREVKEEVGLDIYIEKILYATTFFTSKSRQVVVITYLCRCDHTDVTLSFEHSDFKWANKEEQREYLHEGIIDDFDKHHVFDLEELI